jgi:hypothetical protein
VLALKQWITGGKGNVALFYPKSGKPFKTIVCIFSDVRTELICKDKKYSEHCDYNLVPFHERRKISWPA